VLTLTAPCAVPIVALTAHALEAERVAALTAGFDEVIPKPCLPDELAAAIDRLLAQDGSRRLTAVRNEFE
jgi:DNA-binding response OmpR family regulator